MHRLTFTWNIDTDRPAIAASIQSLLEDAAGQMDGHGGVGIELDASSIEDIEGPDTDPQCWCGKPATVVNEATDASYEHYACTEHASDGYESLQTEAPAVTWDEAVRFLQGPDAGASDESK